MLAALKNALRCIDMKLPDARIVVSGGGAAGSAIVQLLLAAGAVDVAVSDRPGLLNRRDESLTPAWPSSPRRPTRAADRHPARRPPGRRRLHRRQRAAHPRTPSGSTRWPTSAIVFALANPDPEVDIYEATQRATVVASGRSDYPNQINNVLAFPGVFRGLLDARATDVTTEMLIKAADAIASSSPTSSSTRTTSSPASSTPT